MKYWIILMFMTLFIAEVFLDELASENESSDKPISEKEKFRLGLKHFINGIGKSGIVKCCPRKLTPEEIVFGDQKLTELVKCGNATIDMFADKLDDDVTFKDPKSYGKVAGPVCEVFDNMFSCVSDFNPVIDMCLEDSMKLFMNKLFKIVPLIQQSACLRNGALIAEIVEHEDGVNCMYGAFHTLVHVGIIEVFDNNSTELFGGGKSCNWLSESLQKLYVEVGECSGDVLDKVKDMLGFFCERTHCERYLDDLQCY